MFGLGFFIFSFKLVFWKTFVHKFFLVVILQDKKLLELPKLLDICAIYGHENKDLTRILVSICPKK